MVRNVTRTIYTTEIGYKMYNNETQEIVEGEFVKLGITPGTKESELAQARDALKKCIGKYGKLLECWHNRTYSRLYVMSLEYFILHAEPKYGTRKRGGIDGSRITDQGVRAD